MRHRSTLSSFLRTRLRAFVLCGIAVALAGCGGPGVQTDPTAMSGASLRTELAAVRAEAAAMPQEAYWPYREALLLAELDSTAQAMDALERALALRPDDAPALSWISKLDYEAGRHQTAIARLEDAARRGPLPTELQIALGLHYEAVGNFDASDSLFERVRSDHNSVAYYALRSDDLERARRIAAKSLELDPNSAASHNDFGITRLYDGDPQTARTHFLRALEIDPEHLGALYNLALVETHYLLDEAEGRSWFERYQRAGGEEDPDGLAEHFDDASARQARR